jgi:hypothetical protein
MARKKGGKKMARKKNGAKYFFGAKLKMARKKGAKCDG